MKLKRIVKWSAGAIAIALFLAVLAVFVAYWRSSNDCDRITAAQGDLMKAIIYCDYGSPDVLKLEEIAKPVPNDDQVLIKVRAAAANPLDWHEVRGTPYNIRLMATALRKPKDTRLGIDLAGQIEAVGKNVTGLKPGDEVFGTGGGAFAEYARAREADWC